MISEKGKVEAAEEMLRTKRRTKALTMKTQLLRRLALLLAKDEDTAPQEAKGG